MVLVLTLTLPVVELRDEDEESTDGEDEDDPTRPKITIDNAKEQHDKYDGWSRTATTTQMIVAPVFIATVVASKSLSLYLYAAEGCEIDPQPHRVITKMSVIGAAQDGFIVVPVACVLGLLLSFLVRRFSTEEQPPRFYGALCFMGFLVAITWIFLVANEVVGILQAFGMIFGVSDAILGLTIFAMVSVTVHNLPFDLRKDIRTHKVGCTCNRVTAWEI